MEPEPILDLRGRTKQVVLDSSPHSGTYRKVRHWRRAQREQRGPLTDIRFKC